LNPLLRLLELGPYGEARDLEVRCETCQSKRRLAEAFGPSNREKMPNCRGRRPHLRDFDPEGCELKMRPIILGASNSWFPVIESSIAIPIDTGRLPQLVIDYWAILQAVTTIDVLRAFRAIGQLRGDLAGYSDEEIFDAIREKRLQGTGLVPSPDEQPDLKTPEWHILTNPDPALNSKDFRLREVPPPPNYASWINKVVLVERLKEVRALIGFTRIDSNSL